MKTTEVLTISATCKNLLLNLLLLLNVNYYPACAGLCDVHLHNLIAALTKTLHFSNMNCIATIWRCL